MKKMIALLLLTFSLGFAQAQDAFMVVRVVGKVESPALAREVKTGDVIQSKDKLRFANKESYIIVNSPQTGRKKISGVPDNAPREFLQLLQSFVQPELKSTASRSISVQYLEMLQNSLAFDTLLILGDGYVGVNTQKLSLKKPAVIRSWYSLNKKMNYKIISDEGGFHLNAQFIFENTVPAVTPKVMIEYFEDEKDEPAFSPGILLAAFIPLYVDENALTLEIQALLSNAAKAKSYSDKLMEIKQYLVSEYAGVQEDNLKFWLKKQGVLSE